MSYAINHATNTSDMTTYGSRIQADNLSNFDRLVFAVWSDHASSSAVPEPATLALLTLGLAGLGAARRRKVEAA